MPFFCNDISTRKYLKKQKKVIFKKSGSESFTRWLAPSLPVVPPRSPSFPTCAPSFPPRSPHFPSFPLAPRHSPLTPRHSPLTTHHSPCSPHSSLFHCPLSLPSPPPTNVPSQHCACAPSLPLNLPKNIVVTMDMMGIDRNKGEWGYVILDFKVPTTSVEGWGGEEEWGYVILGFRVSTTSVGQGWGEWGGQGGRKVCYTRF